MEQKIKQWLRYYARSSGMIGGLSKAVFPCLKKVKDIVSIPQHIYEIYVAKFLAQYCFFLYWPLYKLLDFANIRFITNVAPGVGHTIPEFDNFLHQKQLQEISPTAKYVVVLKNFHIYSDFLSLYRRLFSWAVSSTLLYDLLLPMWMKYNSLCVDVGVSRMKWYFPDKKNRSMTPGRPYVFQLSTFDGISQSTRYYARRCKNPSYYPLQQLRASSEPLLEKLGLKGKKLCLVHLKTHVMNGTARITDPKTYIPALQYLVKQGYTNVFIGREEMPKMFEDPALIQYNYAQSKQASFKNDFLLFKACDFSIVNGSGVSYFADCMDKPLLYLNSWHIAMPPCNHQSIHVPALVMSREQKFLKFSRQFKLYLETATQDEKFPDDLYIAQNATEEEILHATKELLELQQTPALPLTILQEQFNRIDEGKGWLSVSMGRTSQFFLEQHRDLF